MGDRKLIQYVDLKGWMIRDLGFSTNEALIYAVIFGFSQDGKSEYRGGRHYLAKSLDISFSTLDRALNNLVNTGYIVRDQFIYRNMVCNNYKVDLDKVARYLDDSKYPSQNEYPSQNDEGYSQNEYTPRQNDEHSITSILKNNKKEIEGKPSIPAKLGNLKHPRNFSTNSLTDDLNSLGELEEKELQKKEKQKSQRKKTLYQKCIDEIDNPVYNFDDEVKQRLKDFLPTTLQASEYAVKGINQWIFRLKALIAISNVPQKQIEVIEYSISHSITGFINPNKKRVSALDHSDGIAIQTLSQKDAAELLAREAEEYGVI